MGFIDAVAGNPVYLVLLILLIIYIPTYIHVKTSPKMKERGIVPYGPFIMIKTKRGVRMLDKIARYRRFWTAFGTLSKIMAFFLMATIILILCINVSLLPTMLRTGTGIGIEYALAIPGLNPMLPLVYGIIGLIVAVVVHEIAHGVQTRANNMKVESMGILHAVVPMGAFVEPNDEEIRKCGRKARSTIYAAGIAVNLSLAIVLFLVMTFGMMGTLSSNFGGNAAVVNVTAGSPADDSGIGFSSVIWGVQTDVSDPGSLTTFTPMNYIDMMNYNFTPGDEYLIRYATESNPNNYSIVRMGVFIEGVAKGSPADAAGIKPKSFIMSVDGVPISNISSFRDIMASWDPNVKGYMEIEICEYQGGSLKGPETLVVYPDNNNGTAFLGVFLTFSGFNFTTPDIMLEMIKNPLYGAESLSEAALAAVSYIGKPFRGYSPMPAEIQWWYGSSIMGDQAFWIVVQAMFWIFWLNLVLGVTNALPAVPFDGGYLLKDGVGAIVDRTHKDSTPEKREMIENGVTRTVSYATLFILMMVMIAILF